MISHLRTHRVVLSLTAAAGLFATACGVETTTDDLDPEVVDEAPSEGAVLHNFYADGLGEITIVDESGPDGEPSIGILLLSSAEDTYSFPIVNDDGADITALEYIAAYDPEALGGVDQRIVDDHVAQTGSAVPRDVSFALSSVVHTQGSCDSGNWQAYFNGQASSYGGVSTPTHLLNRHTNSDWWYYGNTGSYDRVVVGACFVSQSDGYDNLTVRIERKPSGSSSYTPVSGTQRTLNTSINGGYRRYVYKNNTFCNTAQRRIAVAGRPDGGIYPGDEFHLAGAWGGRQGCWLTL